MFSREVFPLVVPPGCSSWQEHGLVLLCPCCRAGWLGKGLKNTCKNICDSQNEFFMSSFLSAFSYFHFPFSLSLLPFLFSLFPALPTATSHPQEGEADSQMFVGQAGLAPEAVPAPAWSIFPLAGVLQCGSSALQRSHCLSGMSSSSLTPHPTRHKVELTALYCF